MYRMTNIGALIKVVAGFSPRASATATINGAAIDRQDILSCVLHGRTGAAAGSPTAQTYDLKLQDSADGSTSWADLTGAVITQITAIDTSGYVDVNLLSAKRYIRSVGTVAFTAGTSPTLEVACAVVLGGAVVTAIA